MKFRQQLTIFRTNPINNPYTIATDLLIYPYRPIGEDDQKVDVREVRKLIILTKAWSIDGNHVESIYWDERDKVVIVQRPEGGSEYMQLGEDTARVDGNFQQFTVESFNHDTNQEMEVTLKAEPGAEFPTLHRYSDNISLTALYDFHQKLFALQKGLADFVDDQLAPQRIIDLDNLITSAHHVLHKFESGQVHLSPTLSTLKNQMTDKLSVFIAETGKLSRQ